MVTDYQYNLKVTLTPRIYRRSPEIMIGCQNLDLVILEQTKTFEFNCVGKGTQNLIIDFLNKEETDTDISSGNDMAVIIDEISFFGIADPRFIWAGKYRPRYPARWYAEQIKAGYPPQQEHTNINYLGWNGEWRLDFSLPVFTWMHQTTNLGWIHY